MKCIERTIANSCFCLCNIHLPFRYMRAKGSHPKAARALSRVLNTRHVTLSPRPLRSHRPCSKRHGVCRRASSTSSTHRKASYSPVPLTFVPSGPRTATTRLQTPRVPHFQGHGCGRGGRKGSARGISYGRSVENRGVKVTVPQF